jgi:hypothetical protein
MFRPTDSVIVDTTGNWEAFDPIVMYGVFAVNSDGSGVKVGNGITRWSSLVYLGSNTIGGYNIESGVPLDNELIIYEQSATTFVYRLQGYIDTVDNWEGTNFNDWPTNYSLIYNGTTLDYQRHQPYNTLPFATTPIGHVLLDDGTWGYPTIINPISDLITDLIEADDAYIFGTLTLGGYPTEATSITLTTDGVSLFIDDQKVWTIYNDGEGSGLDADTLDGHHYTYFATGPTTATAGHFTAFGSSSPNQLVDSEYDFASFATPNDITTVDDDALVYSIVFGG